MLSQKKILQTREMYVEETECAVVGVEKERIFLCICAGVYAQYKMSSHIDRVKGAAAPFQECAYIHIRYFL